MSYVVFHESAKDQFGNLLPCGVGDRHLTDPNGNKHRSRGIVQINQYYNPTVTDEMAFNASFSLEYLASELRDGKCSKWTTCREYLRKYPLLSKK
jgi:hypothetical protein